MDFNGSGMESELVYPILCIPKRCTNLETNCEISDNVFIEVNITSPDTEGNETCIYNGFCNIKLVGDYDVQYKPQEIHVENGEDQNISIIIADNQNTPYDPEVWMDPVRSPYVYNRYDEAETQEYSVCRQTRTSRIMFEQHNTYITKNVYNYKEAVHYSSYDEVEDKKFKKQESCQPIRSSDLNIYEEDEFECGVFLSHLPEEIIMNEKQNRDLEERKYVNVQSENGALTQLMSSDIQSVSKQRKTILYLGPEPHNGQTIQQIAYRDPAVGCSGLSSEVDNEVVIREKEDSIIPHQKKYQCANCFQIFEQISEFREHIGNHTGVKYNRHQKLKAVNDVKYMCTECGKTLKNQAKFEIHCLGHGNPDLECSKCHKVFASKFTLRAHRKIHNRKFPCKYCTRSYSRFEDARAHMTKKHFIFTCDQCDYCAEEYADMKTHQQIHEGVYKDSSQSDLDHSLFDDVKNESDIIHCSERDWKFERVDNFTSKNVNQENRNNVEDFEDDERDIIIRDPRGIQVSRNIYDRRDIQTAQDMQIPEDIQTPKDIQVPRSIEDGNIEMEIEEGHEKCYEDRDGDSVIAKVMANKAFLAKKIAKNKRYSKVCNVCGKTFDRISDLKRHLIEHVVRITLAKSPVTKSGILNLQCEVCNDTFHFVERYKAHLREHAKLTIYKCTFCNKCFSDSSNFSKHKKIHGAIYFQCDLCQRKFNSKKMLIRHIEYHNTNSPIPCMHCDKEFFFESMLNKHIKSAHTKETASKFRCRFCFKHYKTLKEKWDHEWKVHNVRKIVVDCLICGSKFRKYSELKRHCYDKHNIGIPRANRLLKAKKRK